MQSVEAALSRLRNLGSPAELRDAAERGIAPASRPKVNAHIHLPPNFSAFTTVRQAVELAAQQKIGALGVSNYYDYEVYGDFADLASQNRIFPLFGLEIISLVDRLAREGIKINDPGNPGKMYLCGKGITRFAPFNDKALNLLETIRRNDSTRMAKMVDRLRAVFDEKGVITDLTDQKIIDRVVARHGGPRQRVYLQERHICQAFQERLFEIVKPENRPQAIEKLFGQPPKSDPVDAVAIQNEIRSQLMKTGKPAYLEETFVSFEHAYQLVLELGGIPCYPTLADGAKPICAYEEPAEKLISRMKTSGIFFAEFIPIRNHPEILGRYVRAMRQANIPVTAGTEHNTLELLPIEPTCLNDQPIPEDLQDIFWEGACVVAAHQFLTLNGELGYVDHSGRVTGPIESFRRLGAAVTERYYQTT